MTETNVQNQEVLTEDENVSKVNDQIEIKDINYLDKEILNIKSYTLEESNNLEEQNDNIQDFDESLYDNDISNVNEKQVTTGVVVSVNERGVLVDIGFKSEGIIDKSEFKNLPKPGDKIDAFIVCFEDRRGRLILSKERADFEQRWNELRTAFADETLITGFISKRIKGGMVVDLGVVNAFLPGSQIDVKTVTDFDEYVGNEYDFKIVKFNEFRQNIVVSRKATLSDSVINKELLKDIKVGTSVDGVVKNITDFGAFVDLGGIDGLLHITDITWGRINHPKEKLEIGNQITVMIIDYDKEKNRVSLGLKQLTKDPWMNISDKYIDNAKVTGKIVNIMNYGIFVELEEGIEGLVHISEISWTKHIKHPSDIYKVGDKIDAVILSVDIDDKKISLGIKQLLNNPWNDIADKFNVDDKCIGKISNIVQNGIYIEIENNIEGFMHNSDISWTRKIKNASNLFNVADEIEVQLLEINTENKKIIFGKKQLVDNPWLKINDFFNIGDDVDSEILYMLDKGIIVLLPNDFEGIIPISKINNPENYNVGDKVSVKISEIDSENNKISLTSNVIPDDKNVDLNTSDVEKNEEKEDLNDSNDDTVQE